MKCKDGGFRKCVSSLDDILARNHKMVCASASLRRRLSGAKPGHERETDTTYAALARRTRRAMDSRPALALETHIRAAPAFDDGLNGGRRSARRRRCRQQLALARCQTVSPLTKNASPDFPSS